MIFDSIELMNKPYNTYWECYGLICSMSFYGLISKEEKERLSKPGNEPSEICLEIIDIYMDRVQDYLEYAYLLLIQSIKKTDTLNQSNNSNNTLTKTAATQFCIFYAYTTLSKSPIKSARTFSSELYLWLLCEDLGHVIVSRLNASVDNKFMSSEMVKSLLNEEKEMEAKEPLLNPAQIMFGEDCKPALSFLKRLSVKPEAMQESISRIQVPLSIQQDKVNQAKLCQPLRFQEVATAIENKKTALTTAETEKKNRSRVNQTILNTWVDSNQAELTRRTNAINSYESGASAELNSAADTLNRETRERLQQIHHVTGASFFVGVGGSVYGGQGSPNFQLNSISFRRR